MKNHISLKKLTIHKYFLSAVAFALGLTGGLVAYAAGTYQSITPKSKGVFQYGDNVVLSGDEIKTIDDNLDIVNANLNGLKFDKDGSGNWGYYKPGDSQLTLFAGKQDPIILSDISDFKAMCFDYPDHNIRESYPGIITMSRGTTGKITIEPRGASNSNGFYVVSNQKYDLSKVKYVMMRGERAYSKNSSGTQAFFGLIPQDNIPPGLNVFTKVVAFDTPFSWAGIPLDVFNFVLDVSDLEGEYYIAFGKYCNNISDDYALFTDVEVVIEFE